MIRQDIVTAMKKMTDEQLGKAVREYFVEANHGGWDGWDQGFPKQRLRGVLELIRDMTLWLENYGSL